MRQFEGMAIEEFGDSISIYPGDVFSPSTITWEERKREGWTSEGDVRHRVAKDPESQSLDSRSLLEIILVDDTSGDARVARMRLGDWWDLHMTNSTRSFLPPCLPSLLTLMAQGHTPGIIIFIPSRMSVCLPVRLFVCPYIRSVLPFHVCLLCLAVRLLFSHTAEISFRMLSRAPPEASLFPPPRTRDGALSFLRATRDGKSSRPPLLLGRYPLLRHILWDSCWALREWKVEHLRCNYMLWRCVEKLVKKILIRRSNVFPRSGLNSVWSLYKTVKLPV